MSYAVFRSKMVTRRTDLIGAPWQVYIRCRLMPDNYDIDIGWLLDVDRWGKPMSYPIPNTVRYTKMFQHRPKGQYRPHVVHLNLIKPVELRYHHDCKGLV